MDLKSVASQKYDIGRCAIFRADVWDGTTNLFSLNNFGAANAHIGNTEGEVSIEPNSEYSELTLPESTGPAAIKRYLSGSRPEFEVGVFPNPTNLGLFSPTGFGSAGQSRRRAVREHTLWIVPEELFLAPDANGFIQEVSVTYSGGAFSKDDPVAGPRVLTADEQLLADVSLIIWRADFTHVVPTYRHEDGGKSLRNITVNVQQDFNKPDGCQLYLVFGELASFPTLDIEPTLST